MKKNGRMLTALLVCLLSMTTGLFANGSSDNGDGADASKPVTLKILLIGDPQPDAQKVYDEINKIALRDINATVEVEYTGWTDWPTKYNLMLASGESYDLAPAYGWTGYPGLATKKAFAEITREDLETYAPELMNTIPEGFLDDVLIGDKMYMIPNNYINAQANVVVIRGDLREKYGLPEVKTVDDFVNYLLAVAENETDIIGFNGDLQKGLATDLFLQPNNYAYLTSDLNYTLVYDQSDKSGKIMSVLDVPEFKEYVKTMNMLYKAGAINKDIMSSKEVCLDNFVAGTSASMRDPVDSVYQRIETIKKSHPEWKPEMINLSPGYAPPLSLHLEGLVIPASSKKVEKALMFANLMITNPEYQNLLNYGIEGYHYEIVEGKYSALPASKDFGYEANVPWGFWNDDLRLQDSTKSDDYYKTYENWRNAAFSDPNPVAKIALDDSKVKTEVASINNIASVFIRALESGGLSFDEQFDAIHDKLEQAGIYTVIAEFQSQIDAKLK